MRITLTRSATPRRPWSDITQSSAFFRLPVELMFVVKDALNPADAVCLAQTCRELHALLDYTLPDVYRVALAWVSGRRDLGMKMRRFVFEATERMDRDRLLQLERRVCINTRSAGRTLVCGFCIKTHPADYFSESERQRTTGERKRCIASQQLVRICDFWKESLAGLRYWRQALITMRAPRGLITAPHDTHPPRGFWYLPRSRWPTVNPHRRCEGDCVLTINCRDQLVITRRITILKDTRPRYLTQRRLSEALAEYHHRKVCRHTKLGDAAVLDVYDQRLTQGSPQSMLKQKSCTACETSWWFGTERELGMAGYLGVMEMRCFLSVRRVMGDLSDPWDRKYLTMTEGDFEPA